MNKVILMGRLASEPTTGTSNGGKTFCNFTMAVKRERCNDKTDFIKCTVWGKTAETFAKFMKKGEPVSIVGSWRVDSYTDTDGMTKYWNSCNVESFYFVPRVKAAETGDSTPAIMGTAPHPIAVDADFTKIGNRIGEPQPTATPFDTSRL